MRRLLTEPADEIADLKLGRSSGIMPFPQRFWFTCTYIATDLWICFDLSCAGSTDIGFAFHVIIYPPPFSRR